MINRYVAVVATTSTTATTVTMIQVAMPRRPPPDVCRDVMKPPDRTGQRRSGARFRCGAGHRHAPGAGLHSGLGHPRRGADESLDAVVTTL